MFNVSASNREDYESLTEQPHRNARDLDDVVAGSPRHAADPGHLEAVLLDLSRVVSVPSL